MVSIHFGVLISLIIIGGWTIRTIVYNQPDTTSNHYPKLNDFKENSDIIEVYHTVSDAYLKLYSQYSGPNSNVWANQFNEEYIVIEYHLDHDQKWVSMHPTIDDLISDLVSVNYDRKKCARCKSIQKESKMLGGIILSESYRKELNRDTPHVKNKYIVMCEDCSKAIIDRAKDKSDKIQIPSEKLVVYSI